MITDLSNASLCVRAFKINCVVYVRFFSESYTGLEFTDYPLVRDTSLSTISQNANPMRALDVNRTIYLE